MDRGAATRQGGETLDIRTVPAVVSGDPNDRMSIVTAKSIPAKKYGINTAEPVSKAMRKCPGLIVVGGDSNKLLAKMASDFEKPDKVHTLWINEIEEKMWPLPVADLLWVGKKSAEKLVGLGYEVIELDEGFNAWKSAGKPVVIE